jgi:hypothetical protein
MERGPEQGRPKGRDSGGSPRSAQSPDADRERLLQKRRGERADRANFAPLLLCFIAIPGQFIARNRIEKMIKRRDFAAN